MLYSLQLLFGSVICWRTLNERPCIGSESYEWFTLLFFVVCCDGTCLLVSTLRGTTRSSDLSTCKEITHEYFIRNSMK